MRIPVPKDQTIDIAEAMCPAGTSYFSNVLTSMGGFYVIYVFLPIPTKFITSITCNEFRPGGQTTVKDTSPTITILGDNSNCVVIQTSNSSFASYVGKAATAALTIAY